MPHEARYAALDRRRVCRRPTAAGGTWAEDVRIPCGIRTGGRAAPASLKRPPQYGMISLNRAMGAMGE